MNRKKKIILALFITGMVTIARGQNLELKDLNIPNSPAFTILDYSPKVIDRPGTAKAFSTNIVSLLTQSNGIPKNFSIEVSPFWFFRNNLNAYSYLGIDPATGKQKNIFCNIRNASISFGSVYKDSIKAKPFNANYLSVGGRINPIKIDRKGVTIQLKKTIDSLAQAQVDLTKLALGACLKRLPADATSQEINACQEEFFKKDKTIPGFEKKIENLLAVRPLFQLDIAFAGSWTFRDNSFSDDHHYRTGVWTTMELNLPLTNTKDIDEVIANKNYLSIYGKLRYIKEDSTKDYINFKRSNLLDIGGRIEFTFNKFSFSFETVHRINQTNSEFNTNRNVGILEYKINDNLFLSGSFGKNFGNVNNMLALFGLNWGFGKEAINKTN